MAKREQEFGQGGRPEDGHHPTKTFDSPLDPAKKATAAQMAGRKIASGSKPRQKTPRSGGNMGGGSFGNSFGGQPAASFPQPQMNQMPPSSNNSFPSDNNSGFSQAGFSFTVPSAGVSNPFTGMSHTADPTPAGPYGLSVLGPGYNQANQAPAQQPIFGSGAFGGFGQQNTASAVGNFGMSAPSQGLPQTATSNGMFGQPQSTQPSLFGSTGTSLFTTKISTAQPSSMFGQAGSHPQNMFGQAGSKSQNIFGQSGSGSQNTLGQAESQPQDTTGQQRSQAPPSSDAPSTPASIGAPTFSLGASSFSQFKPTFTLEKSTAAIPSVATSTPATPGAPTFSLGASSFSQYEPAFTMESSTVANQPGASAPIQRTTPSPTDDAMHTSPEFPRTNHTSKDGTLTTATSNVALATPAAAPAFNLFGQSASTSAQDSPHTRLFGADPTLSASFFRVQTKTSAPESSNKGPDATPKSVLQDTIQASGNLFGQNKSSYLGTNTGTKASETSAKIANTGFNFMSGFERSASPNAPSFQASTGKPATIQPEAAPTGQAATFSSSTFEAPPKADKKAPQPSLGGSIFSAPAQVSKSSAPSPSLKKPSTIKRATVDMTLDGNTSYKQPTTTNDVEVSKPRPEAPKHWSREQKVLFLQNFRFRDLRRVLQSVIESKSEWSDLTPVMDWYLEQAKKIKSDEEPDVFFLKDSPASNSSKRAATGSLAGEKSAKRTVNESRPTNVEKPNLSTTRTSAQISTGSPTKKTPAQGRQVVSQSGDLFQIQSSAPSSSKRKADDGAINGDSAEMSESASKRARGGDNAAVSFLKNVLEKKDTEKKDTEKKDTPPTKKDPQPTKSLIPPTISSFETSKSVSPTPSTSGGTSVFDDPAHKNQSFSGNFFNSFSNPQDGSDKENQEATDESDAEEERPDRTVKDTRSNSKDSEKEKAAAEAAYASMASRISGSPSPAPVGNSLFGRISKPNSNPESPAESSTESAVQVSNSLFGRIAKPNSNPESPAEPSDKVSASAEQPKSLFASFGSSNGPVDHTYNRDSPLKFGGSTFNPSESTASSSRPTFGASAFISSETTNAFSSKPTFGFSVTPASPGKPESAVEGSLSTTPKAKPLFGGQSTLFGGFGSTTPAGSPAKSYGFGGDGASDPKPSFLENPASKSGPASIFNLSAHASPLPSTTTSRATTPGLSGGDTSAPESSAAEVEGKSGEEFSNLPQQKSLTDLTEEELENEEVLFEELTVKVRLLTKDEDDKPKWDTKGSGPLRILKHKTNGAVRALMRAHPGGKIVLNARIPKGMKGLQAKPKMAQLPFANDGKIISWYFTLGSEAATAALVMTYNTEN